MCTHALECEYCQDHRGEAIMFKKLAKDRRRHCVAMRQEMDAMQTKMRAYVALQQKAAEQEKLIKDQAKQLAKLRARRQEDAEYVMRFEKQAQENVALTKRVKALKQEKRDVEQAQCILKQVVKEHKQTNALLLDKVKRLEFDAQVQALTEQVDKLRALNLHLSTTCVSREQELSKLQSAYLEVKHLVFDLKQQCDIFCYVFKTASVDKSTQEKLLAIMESIQVESTDLLRG